MRDCVRWSIQNKNKVPLLLLRKILYIQKPCLTLPARHGFWTKSNPFPYRPCRNWRNFSRKNSKKLWFYEVLSLFTQPNGFIVGNKILLSPSRPMPLRSAQNPHNCWVFETIYHPSCVLLGRPLHSKSCIKIVVVCRRIFLWKSVSTPKCQKLDKFSMKRTGTL